MQNNKTEKQRKREQNASAGLKRESKQEVENIVAKREDIMFLDCHANEVEYHSRKVVNGNAVTDAN